MKRLLMLVACVVLAAVAATPAAVPDPVRLESGLISGGPGTSAEVRVFKGIPFAAPPVGPLRWRAPQPAAAWEGVRAADEFGPRCMQGRGGAGVSEDCLYLNVWTAAESAADRRPVMVWSYGGAFTGGAGSLPGYDGENLAGKGAVVVTYNYRLGPFGWFSHPELSAESGYRGSGNQGLMDAIAALQWVQTNIEAFGGDPNRVTLFGESAGGALVSALVGSPEARGLFHRAVSQSGAWGGAGQIAPMTRLAEAEAAGRETAAALDARSLAELRARPAEDVLRMGSGLRPIVDGKYLPEDLSVTFSQGRQYDVDVLLGSNRDEGNFPFFGLNAESAERFAVTTRERWGEHADTFLAAYPVGSANERQASQLAAFSDEYSWQMRNWAHLQAKLGRARAYVYYFTHEPPGAPGQPSRGAMHTAEIPYVFNNPSTNWVAADRALAEILSSYWVNFAASGDPNGSGLPVWPEYRDKSDGRAMLLGSDMRPETPFARAKLALYDAFWERQLKALGGNE